MAAALGQATGSKVVRLAQGNRGKNAQAAQARRVNFFQLVFDWERVNLHLVTFIRRFIALILLLAWVPASSHWLLAAALQDAVVDCCVEAKPQSGGESHHDSGCCPFCGTFESGKYLTSTKDKQDAGNETQLIVSPVGQLPLKTSAHTAQSFIPHVSPP